MTGFNKPVTYKRTFLTNPKLTDISKGLIWKTEKVSNGTFTMKLLTSFGSLLVLFGRSYAGTVDHRYKTGEHVELWVNKVR